MVRGCKRYCSPQLVGNRFSNNTSCRRWTFVRIVFDTRNDLYMDSSTNGIIKKKKKTTTKNPNPLDILLEVKMLCKRKIEFDSITAPNVYEFYENRVQKTDWFDETLIYVMPSFSHGDKFKWKNEKYQCHYGRERCRRSSSRKKCFKKPVIQRESGKKLKLIGSIRISRSVWHTSSKRKRASHQPNWVLGSIGASKINWWKSMCSWRDTVHNRNVSPTNWILTNNVIIKFTVFFSLDTGAIHLIRCVCFCFWFYLCSFSESLASPAPVVVFVAVATVIRFPGLLLMVQEKWQQI